MSRAFRIILLVIVFIAYMTKPNKKSFLNQIQNQLLEQGGLLNTIAGYAVPFFGSVVFNEENSRLNDFGVFVTFEFLDGNRRWQLMGIGMFGKWFYFENPNK